jgi:hypothetical protein
MNSSSYKRYFCAAEECFKIFFCHYILCCRRISEDFFLGVLLLLDDSSDEDDEQQPYNNFRLVSGRRPAGDFQTSRKIERIAGKAYRETLWKFLWKFSGIFEQMFKASRHNKSCDNFSGNKLSKKLWRK